MAVVIDFFKHCLTYILAWFIICSQIRLILNFAAYAKQKEFLFKRRQIAE